MARSVLSIDKPLDKYADLKKTLTVRETFLFLTSFSFS